MYFMYFNVYCAAKVLPPQVTLLKTKNSCHSVTDYNTKKCSLEKKEKEEDEADLTDKSALLLEADTRDPLDACVCFCTVGSDYVNVCLFSGCVDIF